MKTGKDWTRLKTFIDSKVRFLLTTHVHPDGDAIGSQIAMASFLKQLGKQVVLVNMDETPKYFRCIDENGWIEKFAPDRHLALLPTIDAAIILDVSDWDRLRDLGQAIRQAGVPVACIDHHIVTDTMGTVQLCDLDASSTGELLYEFLVFSHATFTGDIVDALYASILTDTGSFRFSNTSPRTHEVAADLLRRGARFQDIYQQIYETESRNRMLLKGMLLANMHFDCDGRLAWFVLTRELLQKSGAELWETEGFSELLRTIENVEISLMFAEGLDGTTKVSFRSKGRVPINGLAAKFGGGGHKFASGATIRMNLAQTIEGVLDETRVLLQDCTPAGE